MIIGGLDIATTTGLAVDRGDDVQASSYKPSAKRPFELKKGEVSFAHEAAVMSEFRDFILSWLVAEGIEAMGIEKPLIGNIEIKKPVINMNAGFAGQAITHESRGGTNFGTLYRLYGLNAIAVELCHRLNIPFIVVPQQTWRSKFMGVTSAPRGTQDGGKWLKNRARQKCLELGVRVTNDDQADAVGIAHYTRTIFAPQERHGDLFKTTGN